MWQEMGIDVVGLISPKLEPVDWDVRLVTDAGLRVVSIGVDMHWPTWITYLGAGS
jgi:hypothetical protein